MYHPNHLKVVKSENGEEHCRCGCGEDWYRSWHFEGETGACYNTDGQQCPSCGCEPMLVDGELQEYAEDAFDAMARDARDHLSDILEDFLNVTYDENDPHTAPTKSVAYLDYGYGVRIKITLEHPSASGE